MAATPEGCPMPIIIPDTDTAGAQIFLAGISGGLQGMRESEQRQAEVNIDFEKQRRQNVYAQMLAGIRGNNQLENTYARGNNQLAVAGVNADARSGIQTQRDAAAMDRMNARNAGALERQNANHAFVLQKIHEGREISDQERNDLADAMEADPAVQSSTYGKLAVAALRSGAKIPPGLFAGMNAEKKQQNEQLGREAGANALRIAVNGTPEEKQAAAIQAAQAGGFKPDSPLARAMAGVHTIAEQNTEANRQRLENNTAYNQHVTAALQPYYQDWRIYAEAVAKMQSDLLADPANADTQAKIKQLETLRDQKLSFYLAKRQELMGQAGAQPQQLPNAPAPLQPQNAPQPQAPQGQPSTPAPQQIDAGRARALLERARQELGQGATIEQIKARARQLATQP